MQSITWLEPDEIKRLPPAHGVAAEPILPKNVLEGWIFQPERELHAIQIYVNGRGIAYVPLWERPDVAAVYPQFPHAVRSGYQLILPDGRLRSRDIDRVTIVGYCNAQPCARKGTLVFDEDFAPQVPIPPPDLIKRTQGDEVGAAYKKLGHLFYREMLDVIAPHRNPATIRRILDWGCGSGRVTANFLIDPRSFAVDACDPHADSIEWCKAHLPAGRFCVSPWQPPLPYPDSSFDLVLGLGVVYLFNGTEFADWLRELHRVLAHHGILILTIQGAFAAKVRFPPDALQVLNRDGILDADAADARTPPPPGGRLYRRGFYWTPEGVIQVASKHFGVLDYLEAAFTSDHDLLIVQRVD